MMTTSNDVTLSSSNKLTTPWRIGIIVVGALLLMPLTLSIAVSLKFSSDGQIVFAFTIGGLCVWLALLLAPPIWRLAQGSVRADFIPTHSNAEKRVILSGVESSIANGYYERAVEQFDALIEIHGVDERLFRVAIDFYLGKPGATLPDGLQRGEALLRRMRSERPEQFERYATQRLIDVYMMKVETHPKAITELRRMAARFPGTPEANGALAAIERLKG